MSVIEEENLPAYVDFYRDWEDKPLREIDNFYFFIKKSGESNSSTIDSSRFVALEDISSSEHDIVGRGLVKSQKEQEADVLVQLSQIIEWSVEFGSTESACGVWVRTLDDHWYRLVNPKSDYEPLYRSLHHKFSITTKLFFVMYEDVTADFDEIIRKIGFTEDALVKEADFICSHLKSDPILKRSAFIRELQQKQKALEQQNPNAKPAPRKRGRPPKIHSNSQIPIVTQEKPKEKPKVTEDFYKRHYESRRSLKYSHLGEEMELEEIHHERSARKLGKKERRERRQEHKEAKRKAKEEKARLKAIGRRVSRPSRAYQQEADSPSLSLTQSAQFEYPTQLAEKTPEQIKAEEERAATLSYKGLTFNTLKNLPKIVLTQQGRLQCFICQKTYSRTLLKDFIDHLHKHRTSLLGAMSERERTSLRLLSFLNQIRVRAFIEGELASDKVASEENIDDFKTLMFSPWPSLPANEPQTLSLEVDPPLKRKFEEINGEEAGSEKKVKTEHEL